MVNTSMEADTAPERNVASSSDNTKPLVSNEDMTNYSVTSNPRVMEYMPEQRKQLDFTHSPVIGYDACEPNYKPYDSSNRFPEMTRKGAAYYAAAGDALNSPEKSAPTDLSDENKRNVDSIAKGAEDYSKGIGTGANSDENLKKLKESISKVPSKEMDDVLAGVNEKLKSQGLRIEQVPDTREIWMGKKDGSSGRNYLHTRLREADCKVR